MDVPGFAHVEEPNTIDMVSINKEKTEVDLGLVQQNPWDDRTLALLARKVRTYSAFVTSGTMQREYPTTANKKVFIEVGYFVEPDERALKHLTLLGEQLRIKGIGLRWLRLPSSEK